ncbi:hypothetical protein [Halalkalibacter okhensis]|uniref:Uncharacterized protein n=1 Tax=Halalkalibacter okhensis TaxID=333138 RepID=A0A0B0IIK7_9BACI|nr:hypothetical protein [Halalkalibacter okhensis]KHF40717.1 hypothetical protein LQ50_07960 [Halalkalibacter okhensis]
MSSMPITVYYFRDAPDQLKNLSNNGGDEDWIAIVPKEFHEWHGEIDWINSWGFGSCHVDKYILDNGDKVFIGCHS